MSTFSYIGSELAIFQNAKVWKQYFSTELSRYISGRVLEVGAGLGATGEALQAKAAFSEWVFLEPDAGLLSAVKDKIQNRVICGAAVLGTVADLHPDERFDTILYVDVVEHLEEDRAEMDRVRQHLKPGGKLIVLSPAHQFLYSQFDKEIGHYRRYNRTQLRKAVPGGFRELKIFYMDSVGLFASAANRLFLKQGRPTEKQILFWDRTLVRLSRFLDPILGRRVGKTIVGIWERT